MNKQNDDVKEIEKNSSIYPAEELTEENKKAIEEFKNEKKVDMKFSNPIKNDIRNNIDREKNYKIEKLEKQNKTLTAEVHEKDDQIKKLENKIKNKIAAEILKNRHYTKIIADNNKLKAQLSEMKCEECSYVTDLGIEKLKVEDMMKTIEILENKNVENEEFGLSE